MNIPLSDKEKTHLLNTTDLYSVMQAVLLREDNIDIDREYFWVIGLEPSARILFIELVSMGSQQATIVEPMEVFSLALQKRAANIILCHNHPSGNLTPSPQDRDLTDRLIQVGLIVNLPVLDHQIITTQSYLSFEEIDLMRELRKSIKYVPSFEVIKRIRKEAADVLQLREAEAEERVQAVQQALQKEKREKNAAQKRERQIREKFEQTVLALRKKGLDVAFIAQITGLSIEEVEKL